jgi:long-chain acyl-CoA synthetase
MTEWQEDLITAEAAGTLDGLFFERVHRTPDLVAYSNHDKVTGSWVDSSWREMARRISRWRAALAEEGFEAGDRAAICLRNCVDWVYFDQSVLGEGRV